MFFLKTVVSSKSLRRGLEQPKRRSLSGTVRPYLLSVGKKRDGFTIVELLVVLVIAVILAIGISGLISKALMIEQNYRRESAVRTALARNLGYAERYLSLLKRTEGGTSIGGSTNIYKYPLEAGGVSFETNHWMHVQESRMLSTNLVRDAQGRYKGAMRFLVESKDERWQPSTNKDFSGYGMLRIAPANIVAAKLEGAGKVRRLVLKAKFPIETDDGVETNEIQVSRPVCLWNMESSPSIALTKTADPQTYSAPGDEIAYSFTVENTGNVTLTNVVVTDPGVTVTTNGSPIAKLAPGGSDASTYSGEYSIKQEDMDAGVFANTASVEGGDPAGASVSTQATEVVTTQATEVVTME